MAADPDLISDPDPTPQPVPEKRGPFAKTWVRRTAIVAAVVLVQGVGRRVGPPLSVRTSIDLPIRLKGERG